MSPILHSLYWLSIRQRVTFNLQDRSARVEVCPRCCSCISAGTLCPDQRRLRSPTATVCIYLMYSVTEGEDVNRTAKFCVPWAVSLEQFAINYARQQFVSESAEGAAEDVGLSLRSCTIMNTIRRCWGRLVIVAPSIHKQTYLLTKHETYL